MPKVVITLPAYRAEHTLEKTIGDIPAGIADLMIVVDDASPDGTVRKARELGLHVVVHQKNRGYGGNQKTCYTEALRAGADIVVLLHPDYQYDPKAVPLLIAPILAGDADMTFGSRFAGLGDPLGGGMPMYRFLGNRFTTVLENLMLGSRFTETHSGMRAYTRRCLLSLPFLGYTDDFSFDTQFLVDAVTSGQRVVEVPIPTRYTKESSSIAVLPSLRYVGASLAYVAQRSVIRGRRGRRSPVAQKGLRRGPLLTARTSIRVEHQCILCGRWVHFAVGPAASLEPTKAERPRSHDARGEGLIIQCRLCGLVSSMQQVGLAEMSTSTEGQIGVSFDEARGRQKALKQLLGHISRFPTRGKRLLLVGADLELLIDEAEEQDWSPQGIASDDVERLGEIVSGPFDAIVVLEGLGCLANPLEGLRKLRSQVDDEGLLVLSPMNVSQTQVGFDREFSPSNGSEDKFFFSSQTLSAVLRKAKFRLVGWQGVSPKPSSDWLLFLSRYMARSRPVDSVDRRSLVFARPH